MAAIASLTAAAGLGNSMPKMAGGGSVGDGGDPVGLGGGSVELGGGSVGDGGGSVGLGGGVGVTTGVGLG